MDDFLVDDASWSIRYMVMNVQTWWPGKKVLVLPRWIVCIRWEERAVHVALSRATVRNAPEYDPARAIDADYEARIHDHYERSMQLEDRRGQPSGCPTDDHGRRVDSRVGRVEPASHE